MRLGARSFVAGAAIALAAIFSTGAFAVVIVDSVKGESRAVRGDRHGPLAQKQRLLSGTTITTGKDAQVVLRFDDGQRVVLNQNTEFKIAEFKFNEAQPSEDRSVFDLLKGALRVVTGAIGKRNQAAFALRTPQVTIGIRGTDFMVVIANGTYTSVTQGTIVATNAAGAVPLGQGVLGMTSASNVITVPISASALPPAAAGAFSNMSTVTLSAAGGAASGAAGTAAGAAGGVSAGTAAMIGAAAAAAAAAGGGGGTTTTTHH